MALPTDRSVTNDLPLQPQITKTDPPKQDNDHVETVELDKASVTIAEHSYYKNFEPIAALNLPDWARTEKQLVRRLDFTVLPTLWLLYMNNYLDRTNIAQARLNSLDDDLGLSGTDFSTAVAALTAGYMLGQIPSNMLMTRVRPSIYLPCLCLLWSTVSATTAAAKTPTQLIVIRFFLGMLESPLYPGGIYLLTCWYARKELAFRIAIFSSGMLFGVCVSGLLAAAIFSGLDGAAGLAGWQWMFLIEALMSIVCGLGAFVTLPDYPHSKTGSQRWSMTEDMRRLAEARMVADRVTGHGGSGKVIAGLKLALKDPKTWLFAFMNLSMTAGYGFNIFFPTLVRGLDIVSSNITALLLTTPPYVTGSIACLTVSWSSDHFRDRGNHMLIGLSLAILGYVITLSTTNIPARYAATFIYASGAFGANVLQYSWAWSSLSATPEKRAAGGAIINVLGHFGNIISPYFFLERERPVYRSAFVIMLSFIVVTFGVIVGTQWYLRRLNNKGREKARQEGREGAFNPFLT